MCGRRAHPHRELADGGRIADPAPIVLSRKAPMSVWRRRLPLPALTLVAIAALSGCGSGTPTTHTRPVGPASTPTGNPPPEPGCPRGLVPCVTKSLALKPLGSPNVDANLAAAILRNQRQIRTAVVSCPRLTGYPTRCSLRGSAVVAGSVRPIVGTITILGVETSTRTYAYSILYSAVRR